MSTTVFIVKELEDGWEWNDVHTKDDAEMYCEDELEIPHDSIEKIAFYEQAMEIRLKRDKHMLREDWYVNLQRVSA